MSVVLALFAAIVAMTPAREELEGRVRALESGDSGDIEALRSFMQALRDTAAQRQAELEVVGQWLWSKGIRQRVGDAPLRAYVVQYQEHVSGHENVRRLDTAEPLGPATGELVRGLLLRGVQQFGGNMSLCAFRPELAIAWSHDPSDGEVWVCTSCRELAWFVPGEYGWKDQVRAWIEPGRDHALWMALSDSLRRRHGVPVVERGEGRSLRPSPSVAGARRAT